MCSNISLSVNGPASQMGQCVGAISAPLVSVLVDLLFITQVIGLATLSAVGLTSVDTKRPDVIVIIVVIPIPIFLSHFFILLIV